VLRLLSDEDIPGDLVRELRRRLPTLDVVRVQEVGLRSAPDPIVLAWAAHEGRQIFTRDRNTMTGHAYDRARQRLPLPGVFVLPERISIGQAVAELEMIVLASEASDWQDQVIFLPL